MIDDSVGVLTVRDQFTEEPHQLFLALEQQFGPKLAERPVHFGDHAAKAVSRSGQQGEEGALGDRFIHEDRVIKADVHTHIIFSRCLRSQNEASEAEEMYTRSFFFF